MERVALSGLVDKDRGAAERVRDANRLTNVMVGTDLEAVLSERSSPDRLPMISIFFSCSVSVSNVMREAEHMSTGRLKKADSVCGAFPDWRRN